MPTKKTQGIVKLRIKINATPKKLNILPKKSQNIVLKFKLYLFTKSPKKTKI